MKTQKGFVIPILIAIIAILIIGGGSYVYLNKKNQTVPFAWQNGASTTQVTTSTTVSPSNSLKTFTFSTGAFSFEYPKDLIATEKDSGVMVATIKDPTKPILGLTPISLSSLQNAGMSSKSLIFKTTTSKGYKIYTMDITAGGQVTTYELLSVDGNESNFIFAYLFPNTVGFSDKDLELILNSISIDKTKVLSLINMIDESVDAAKNKGIDALIKANLSNMRAQAEIYYDYNSNIYTGVCQDKMILKLSDSIKINSGFNISCFASAQAWSASSPLKSTSTGYCVDSTGFGGSVLSPTVGLSGKCK